MVKRRVSFKELIYKNSKTSFSTYSRTSSSVTKIYSESLVLILKKRRPKENYYGSNGKLKRDFSVATDFCILRNYCKKNRDKFVIKRDKTTNCNGTEALSVNDCTEYGRSFNDITKTRVNFDLTTMIVDNLKSLVNDWIRNHLLDNNETKEKVSSIVNRILQRLDTQSNTSSCTYAVDLLVDPNLNDLSGMRNTRTANIRHISSITSVITLPLNNNNLRVMSTLSVPKYLMTRNVIKPPKEEKKEYKKLVIESKLQNKFQNQQSFTKVSNVSIKNAEQKCSERHTINVHKSFEDSARVENNNLNVTINKTEVDRLTYHQISNIDENSPYDDIINDIINTETKLNEIDLNEFNKHMAGNKVRTNHSKLYKKINTREKRKRCNVYNNIKHNKINHNDIVKHIKDIFDYISFIKEINKIKIDISINILPLTEKEQDKDKKIPKNKASKDFTQTADNSMSGDLLDKLCMNKSKQLFFTTKGDILNSNPNLVTLTDSSKSKQKIFSNNNFIDTDTNYLKKLMNKNTVTTNGREIAIELRELKEIIRNLALTAKQMLNTHLKAVGERYDDINKNINLKEKKNATQESTTKINNQKQSKSVQISGSFTKSVTTSNIEINKLSKDFTSVFDKNIYKKSTSYRLFDSETILRVTDMTSGANSTLVDNNTDTFQTSTQKFGSSIDSVSNNRKIYAFYCNSMEQNAIHHHSMLSYCCPEVYYVISDKKDSETQNIAVSSESAGGSKKNNADVEGKPEERKKSIFDCFHTNFQRKFTLYMFFFVPLITIISLVYLYLRGQFSFKPSPSIFPMLTDKKPINIINVTELGFR